MMGWKKESITRLTGVAREEDATNIYKQKQTGKK